MKNIGILTFPGNKKEVVPISNLIKIVNELSKNLHIITGNFKLNSFNDCGNIYFHKIKHKSNKNFLKRAFYYIKTQLLISYQLLKIKDLDIWIFFIGGDTLILPMIAAKILRKKVLLLFPGSSIETLKSSNDKSYKIAKILSNINCKLADKIILYSPSFKVKWDLEKYENKITIGREHFLNFNELKIKTDYAERSNLVGYIGRLSEEKGILNFINAIPKILEKDKNIRFLIIGDGYLKKEVKLYLKNKGLENKVTLLEWIHHNDIPNYLNKLKLLVIPSYTEGLPNIMLEAMACGTPVLATSVGAITDIIKDKKTGFIINDNSEDNIAFMVIYSLNYYKINEIIKKSYHLVKKEFFYDNALKNWEKILNESD